MKLVAKTDIGSQRSENQDSYRGGRRPDDAVWGAACDGMVGARGGRLASTMAVDALQQAIVPRFTDFFIPYPISACLYVHRKCASCNNHRSSA